MNADEEVKEVEEVEEMEEDDMDMVLDVNSTENNSLRQHQLLVMSSPVDKLFNKYILCSQQLAKRNVHEIWIFKFKFCLYCPSNGICSSTNADVDGRSRNGLYSLFTGLELHKFGR